MVLILHLQLNSSVQVSSFNTKLQIIPCMIQRWIQEIVKGVCVIGMLLSDNINNTTDILCNCISVGIVIE